MLDIEKIRADFPILKREVSGRPLIYLDNAATTIVAPEVADVINKAMRELSNYRYGPKKYEERVRERRAWEADSGRDADDG